MTTPLDIVAAAVHAAQCGCGTVEQPARDVAQVAVNALTDERIVEHAVEALMDYRMFEIIRDQRLSPDEIVARCARVVLRSVGEA